MLFSFVVAHFRVKEVRLDLMGPEVSLEMLVSPDLLVCQARLENKVMPACKVSKEKEEEEETQDPE